MPELQPQIDFTGIPDAEVKLNPPSTSGIDFSGIPDAPVQSWTQAPPDTLFDNFKGLFRKDSAKINAKSQNAYAYSEMFNIPLGTAYRHHDAISEHLGGQDMPTTPELIEGLFVLPITAGLMASPAATVLGLATFMALGEAESVAVNLIKGEDYKLFETKGMSEFLPEDANSLTETVVDAFDFIWKGLATKGVFKKAITTREKVLRKIIEEHKLPKEFYLDPADLRVELQRGGLAGRDPVSMTTEEMNIYKSLGLSGTEVRAALKEGISIKVPAETVVKIMDRPWYAKVKSILKLEPMQESRVKAEGKPEFKMGKEEVKKTEYTIKETGEKIAVETVEPTPLAKEPWEGVVYNGGGDLNSKTGIYFTPDKNLAESFAKNRGAYREKLHGEFDPSKKSTKVTAATLDIKNPKKVGYEGVEITPEDILDYKKQGHDSAVVYQNGEVREIIVFDKNQIKSPERVRISDVAETTGKPISKAKQKEILSQENVYKAILDEAQTKASKDVLKELKTSEQYIERLSAESDLISRGDLAAAKSLLASDAETGFEYNQRVVEHELKVFEDLVGAKAKKLKQTIREVTGQVKLGDVISVEESKALRSQIRFEAKAAREAFAAGKKEQALKHKQKQYELLLKQEARDIAKEITDPPPKSVDMYYREAIRHLTEWIDPKFRQAKTLKERQATVDFLSKNEVPDFPKKLLDKLSKKPLNDLTLGELRELQIEVKRLKKLGKLKQKLKKRKIAREREAVITDITETLLKGKPIEEISGPIVSSTAEKGRVVKGIRTARATTLRPSRVTDKIDGGQNYKGPTTKFFIDRVNDATDTKLNWQDFRNIDITNAIKRLGIKILDLTKTREIDGIKYTVDEMIDVYAASKNQRKELGVRFGNNISAEAAIKIIAALSENERAFADAILEDYESNYLRLREAVYENENRDMGYEENYSPMRRTEIDYKTMTQEVVDEILHRNHLKRAYAEKGMTLSRLDILEEFQRPIMLGLYKGWLEQMPKQEQYIALMGIVKDMHRVLDSKMLSDAMGQASGGLGAEYIKALRNYTDRVANPNIYKGFSGIERLSRELRNNTALYYLAGNVLTMGKQLPSVLFYLPDAGPVALMKSFAEFIEDPLAAIEFVKERDPQFRHRQIERELEELKLAGGTNYQKAKKVVGEVGMAGIYMMDRAAITVGWKAVYDAHVQTLGEEGAARLARDVTLRTQPQAAAKDLPDMYATNEFLNWLLQFTNQLNQIYQLGTHDFPSDIKGKRYATAFYTAVALALNALVIWSVTNKKLPEDAKDVADAFTDTAINAIPIVGKSINQGRKGWSGGGEIPPLKGIEGLVQGATDNKKADAARKILEGIGILIGAPGIFIKRLFKSIEKGDPSEMLGPEKKDKKKGRR